MKPGARRWVFLPLAAALGVIVMAACLRLPAVGQYPGPYGDVVIARALPGQHLTEAVGAVTFDYRLYDTLGEEFIFFGAVAGSVLLLRQMRGEPKMPPVPAVRMRAGATVRMTMLWLLPATVVFGLQLAWHGTVTPGGGFQGGTIVATGLVLAYAAGGYKTYQGLVPKPLFEAGKALGAAALLVVGLVGLGMTGAAFANVLPLGTAGQPYSGGIAWVSNAAVTVEVACGMALLVREFLEQAPRE